MKGRRGEGWKEGGRGGGRVGDSERERKGRTEEGWREGRREGGRETDSEREEGKDVRKEGGRGWKD